MKGLRVLVLGGGIAGVTSAMSLARQGVKVILVEKDDFLGGRASRYGCKASDKCTKCGVCLVVDRLRSLPLYIHAGSIEVMEGSRLLSLEGKSGSFTATVVTSPRYVDKGRCTGCGACLKVCPAEGEGAIRRPPVNGTERHVAIDPGRCLRWKGKECALCADACPAEAVDFGASSSLSRVEADAVIVATGFEPASAGVLPDLGYGRFDGVFGGHEVEEILTKSGRLHLSDGSVPKRVAFVQCVGSRNLAIGRDYCSEVCCRYAMRMALAYKRVEPSADITIFHMDLQTNGPGVPEVYKSCLDKVRFVQGMPVDVKPVEKNAGDGTGAGVGDQGDITGRLIVRYEDVWKAEVKRESFDAVVLSVGIWPPSDAREIADRVGINLDRHGFLGAVDSPKAGGLGVRTIRDGVFLAGACQKPRTIPETIAHAEACALAVISMLGAEVA
ncbi:MAG TPA: CoB--CoM heterodisulfide reductase iron-sulfur subunit A family protein [Clostridia bacterium]|nr:CoB--CoM heterodisulfide reductase iron-sulfur subunit A family protein [Clostridia bacterium]